MTTTVNVDLETGDFSQFTSTTTGGGDLAVTAGAALHGSYGMSVTINDTGAIYGLKSVTKSASLRFRFYVHPNGLTMANNDAFPLCYWQQSAGSFSLFGAISLEYTTVGGYRLRAQAYNDAGVSSLNGTATISSAAHYVEMLIVSATTSSSSDGSAQWWLDGVSQGSVTGLDNYNRLTDQNWRTSLGALSGLDAGTSGVFYLDDFSANDTGAEIGPVATVQPGNVFYRSLLQGA